MIVAVVAEKGGVGKTVVATNLAGMRAAAGFRALLLDVDTQGSSTFWTQFRSERGLPQVEAQAHRGEAFRRYVNAPRALHDDIVIDVGAGDGPSLDTALQGADCAVIPVRPTGVDMYTMQLMDHRVAEARELNPRLRALALINQASTNPRHRALGVAIESLREGSRNLTVADTVHPGPRRLPALAHCSGRPCWSTSPGLTAESRRCSLCTGRCSARTMLERTPG